MRTLGPYHLHRELGRGASGVVFEATHPERPGRRFAVKLLEASPDPDAWSRFRREAQLLARLSHPAILRVHDFDYSPHGPYLVSDLVPGSSLTQWATLQRDPDAHAHLVERLADAVHTAHQHGILHRDLKPENVIVRPDTTPLLLDFGLARSRGTERLTRTGQALGTLPFMAPEQAKGIPTNQLTPKVDVWGLGAVLYWLLTEQPPMLSPDWTLLQDAPPELTAICRRALAPDSLRRYPSAAALRDDLARVRRGEPLAAQPRRRRARAAWVLVPLAGALGMLAASLHTPAPPPTLREPETPTPPTTPLRCLELPAPADLDPEAARAPGRGARFLPDGRVLTWSSQQDPVRASFEVWDLDRPEAPTHTIGLRGRVLDALGLASPLRILVNAETIQANGWRVRELTEHTLDDDPQGVRWTSRRRTEALGLAALPDADLLAVGVGAKVELIDLRTWEVRAARGAMGTHVPFDVAFAPDGTSHAALCAPAGRTTGGLVTVWDLERGGATVTMSGNLLTALLPFRDRYLYGDDGGRITSVGNPPLRFAGLERADEDGKPPAHTGPVCALSQVEDLLISASPADGLRTWHLDGDDPQNLAWISDFPAPLAQVTASPDGQRVLAATPQGRVWVFPLETLRAARGTTTLTDLLTQDAASSPTNAGR